MKPGDEASDVRGRGPGSPSSGRGESSSQDQDKARRNPSIPAEEKPGEIIADRYEILALIGKASMGFLYRARDRKAGREVSIRRLCLGDDSHGRKRVEFLHGAHTIVGLSHLNIVVVHDLGEDARGPFTVMESLRGDDLRHKIERYGKVSLEKASPIIEGIARGLAYAHNKGITHGYVNPENVLITDDDLPRLLGFELALLPGASFLSGTGESADILAYVPPEQVRHARRADPRSDVYGVAKTLCHMVTGTVPYSVELDVLPPEIRPAVDRALQPGRGKRTPSIGGFLEDLGRPLALSGGPLAPGTVQPGTCIYCGASNPRDKRFCQTCGSGLFQKCPRCHMDARIGVSNCGSCGVHISRYGRAQAALGTARAHLESRSYDEAVRVAKAGLRWGYLGDELKEVTEEGSADKKKLAEFRSQARQLINEEKYEDAEAPLRSALKLDPSQGDLKSLLEELAERIRERDIRAALAEAEIALKDTRFPVALERCAWVLDQQPDNEQALSVREQAKGLREDHERRIAEVGKLLDDLQFRQAMEKINSLAGDYPWSSEVKELHEQVTARKRGELESLRAKVRELVDEERYEEVEALLRAALEFDPSQEDLGQLLEALPRRIQERDIRRALEEAEEAIAERRFPEALERCDSVLEMQPDDERAAGLKAGAEALRDDYHARLAEARDSVAASEFNNALRQLRDLEGDYPWDESITKLLQETESRKKNRLREHRRQAAEAIAQERYEDAEAPLRNALELEPSQEDLQQLVQELPAKIQRRDIRDALVEAARAIEKKRFLPVIERCSWVLERQPENKEAAKLKTQAEELQGEHRRRLAEVRESLDALEFEMVAEELAGLEKDYPRDDSVRELSQEVEARKQQRLDELRSRAMELIEQGQHEDAEEPLREALTLDPSQKELQRLQKELPGKIREREARRTLDAAQEALQEKRFPLAQELSSQVLSEQPRHKEATKLKKQAAKLKEDHGRRIARTRECLETSRLHDALEQLHDLEKDYPWDTETQKLSQEANALSKTRIQELRAQATELIEEERYGDAENPLREALRLDPSLDDLQGLLNELPTRIRDREIRRALAEAGQALKEKRFPVALERCNWALSQQADNNEAGVLKVHAEKLSEDHHSRVAHARRSLDALTPPELNTALNELRELEKDYSWDPEIKSLHEAARKRKEEILHSLRDEAMDLIDEGRYEDAEGPLRGALQLDPSQEDLKALLEELPVKVRNRETRRAVGEAREALKEERFSVAIEHTDWVLREKPGDVEAAELKARAEELQKAAKAVAIFGGYEAVAEHARTVTTTVWMARPVGSDAPPRFIVKVFHPPRKRADDKAVRAEQDAFLDGVRFQREVLAANGRHWAPVLETGSEGDMPFFVTKYYSHSVQWLLDRPFRLTTRVLHAIVSAVVEGLKELQQVFDRPHGNLKPSNVLIEGEGSITRDGVVLTDPLPGDRLAGKASETSDLRALGAMIYQLVRRRPFRRLGGWPVRPSPAWSKLGRQGETWRRLCDRLLDPDPARAQCSLRTVAETLRAIEKPRKVRAYALAAAAATVATAVPLLLLLGRDRPPRIQLVGSRAVRLEVGTLYRERGCRATDKEDGNLGKKLRVSGSVDVAKVGKYRLVYTVTDSRGNRAKVVRTVKVVDRTSPQITLKGDSRMTLEVGQDRYDEAGWTAEDNYDGDMTARVAIKGSVDEGKVGEYTLVYGVSDSNGNKAEERSRTVQVVDTTAPVIALKGAPSVTLPVGSSYVEPGYTARDNYDGDISGRVEVAGDVDSGTMGEYTLVYGVGDSSGNRAEERKRNIQVVDVTEPVITLLGANPMTVEVGSAYAEPGLSAADRQDGDLTDKVRVSGSVDDAKLGEYRLVYSVTDSSGNRAEVVRSVKVVDTAPPSITLKGDGQMTLEAAQDRYVEPGYTATDNYDGDVTAQVAIEGAVDAARIGDYTLVYSVTDSSGNKAEERSRTVQVVDTTAPVIALKGAASVTLPIGSSYVEPGYTARDNYDGDLSGSVEVAGDVDSRKMAEYVLVYRVRDASGNSAKEKTRKVQVVDITEPVLTLLGGNSITMEVGTAYAEPGYTAEDKQDGNLTGEVKVSGSVDVTKLAEYRQVYSVTDSSGNRAEVVRTVKVVDRTSPQITLKGDSRMTLEVGQDRYDEAGWTAEDNYDGDMTARVAIKGSVDEGKVGEYTLVYGVSDSSGNKAEERSRTVQVVDTTAPVLSLKGDTKVTVPVGSSYVEPGYTARDNCDGDISGRVEVRGGVDSGTMGEYTLVYGVSDSSGNRAEERTRNIQVVDVTEPVITLLGANPMTVEVGTAYAEPGLSAADRQDGDLTDKVRVSGSVNETELGEHRLVYSVTDSSGNSDEAVRTVKVVDGTPPSITLKGESRMTLEAGQDHYVEPGYTATDNYDGDVTAQVAVEGSLDEGKVGEYTLLYSVSDSSGNRSDRRSRTIHVVDTKPPYTAAHAPSPEENTVPLDATIALRIRDDGIGVDKNSITMTVNGEEQRGLTITGAGADYLVTYDPPEDFPEDTVVTVMVSVKDSYDPPNEMKTDQYQFRTGLLPRITKHPEDRTVAGGDSVTFTLEAEGAPPLSFQWMWRKKSDEEAETIEAVAIQEAESRTYTIDAAQKKNEGVYFCDVRNSVGSRESNPATLTVEGGGILDFEEWFREKFAADFPDRQKFLAHYSAPRRDAAWYMEALDNGLTPYSIPRDGFRFVPQPDEDGRAVFSVTFKPLWRLPSGGIYVPPRGKGELSQVWVVDPSQNKIDAVR